MKNVTVTISVTEEAVPYIFPDEKMKRVQLSLMLYPYIWNKTLSYDEASGILGISREELIDIYSSMGIELTEDDESRM